MKKRKKVNTFSLSFLDCICCGFGAVILLFVIINARSAVVRNEVTRDLKAEADRLEREVKVGEKGLVVIKNSLEEIEEEIVESQGLSVRLIQDLQEQKEQLADQSQISLASKKHVNKLKSDIKSLDEEVRRLKAGSLEDDDKGQDIRKFIGSGNRQYLTGLKIGGARILIMVDASASMLGSTIVDVIRRRNASDEDKKSSEKWKQALQTVNWICANFPAGSRFQIYTFNEKARPLITQEGNEWLDGSDPGIIKNAMEKLYQTIPQKGTSLHAVYLTMRSMSPPPDNVFLLVDGLPTMDNKPHWKKNISGRDRLKYFERSEKLRPSGIPINVILFPMEGDPQAAQAFWKIACRSKGSFICPSSDWP